MNVAASVMPTWSGFPCIMYGMAGGKNGAGFARKALEEAHESALVAGVDVRELHNYHEIAAAADLLNVIWTATRPVPEHLMRAIQFYGGYLAGAFSSGDLVGASVGLIGRQDSIFLHSHVVGIHPAMQGRGIGSAMKFHQRSWAIENEIAQIRWTFDPLLSRNAYLNLTKLGAKIDAFIPEFYGELNSENVSGSGTDRFAVTWEVSGPTWLSQPRDARGSFTSYDYSEVSPEFALEIGADGEPRLALDAGHKILACKIPDDITAMKLASPILTSEWRVALRKVLTNLLGRGYEVKCFARRGYYMLQRK